MRLPRRTPVFGPHPTTLSTIPGTAHPLDQPRTKSKSREGPLRSWTGVTSKMTVTILVPVWGVAPHASTRLAPVAAHAHMHDRGTPPAGLVRQAPDHRVTRNALAPATSTPPILTSNTARQHCMVCLNALTRHLQPQAIQASERAQIRAIKDSNWACRGLSDGRCRNPHHRKTSTHTRPRHAQPRQQHLHPHMRRARLLSR